MQTHSPLELVQQLFSKLGAKYVIVVDNDGFCENEYWCFLCDLVINVRFLDEGVIDKNTWLAFLNGQLNENI